MELKVEGIIPAVVTPFSKNSDINEGVFKKLLQYLSASGVHGLFVLGSQGEFYALSHKEKVRLMELAVETVGGKLPIYAGTGTNTTRETVKLSQIAEKIGISAVSVITPSYISPTQQELYEHFLQIAKAVTFPVILYNNPARSGLQIGVDLATRLSKIPNVLGIKNSSADFSSTVDYIMHTGPDFSVLSGHDYYIFATLMYGGKGSISATANAVPELIVEIYERFLKGDFKGSLDAQKRLVPLRKAYSMGTFPQVVKECMKLRNIDVGDARAPVSPLTSEQRKELERIVKSVLAIN
jgi:4-hydroxy-tetrahydrodipicolinate synthase